MSAPRFDDVEVGTELPELRLRVCRADLARYAGASGDFNPIHWNDRTARAVGLPGVIAHGMLTMALAGRAVTEWAGDPARVQEYGVRFTKPVVVPDDDTGAELVIAGRVTERLDGARVRVELTVRNGDVKVLGAARAVVRLDH